MQFAMVGQLGLGRFWSDFLASCTFCVPFFTYITKNLAHTTRNIWGVGTPSPRNATPLKFFLRSRLGLARCFHVHFAMVGFGRFWPDFWHPALFVDRGPLSPPWANRGVPIKNLGSPLIDTPTLPFLQNLSWAFVGMEPIIVLAKFEVCIFTRSWANSDCSFGWGSQTPNLGEEKAVGGWGRCRWKERWSVPIASP